MKSKWKGRIITIPNVLSFFRICLIPVFIWLYCHEKNYTGTVCILVLSGVTDMLDGFIARTFHMVSDFGKILDPVADKLTQTAMLACLLTRFQMMAVPLAMLVIKETFMCITGFMVIRKTANVSGAEWHGKIATCFLDMMIILHVFWYDIPTVVSNICIMVCAVMVAVSFWFYGSANIKILKSVGDTDKEVHSYGKE